MGKVKVGTLSHLTLVRGDVNLLAENEVLISREEGYTILRRRLDNGKLETSVIIPLKDFSKDEDISGKKMEET